MSTHLRGIKRVGHHGNAAGHASRVEKENNRMPSQFKSALWMPLSLVVLGLQCSGQTTFTDLQVDVNNFVLYN
jgi:hypothetical protein